MHWEQQLTFFLEGKMKKISSILEWSKEKKLIFNVTHHIQFMKKDQFTKFYYGAL